MGHPNRAPFDAAVWLLVALAISGSDAATRGLDQDAAYIVTALFLITAVPALVLNYTVGRQELHSSSGSLTRRRLRPCLWR